MGADLHNIIMNLHYNNIRYGTEIKCNNLGMNHIIEPGVNLFFNFLGHFNRVAPYAFTARYVGKESIDTVTNSAQIMPTHSA